MMIIDSHCHLEYEPMASNLEEVVKRGVNNNVKFFLSISTTDDSYEKILKIVAKHPSIYGTYGIHPHETKDYSNLTSSEIINKINLNKKIIGIGESGLDFYYNHSNKDIQIKIFKEHIKASQETGLPLIVHTRSAEQETFDILKKEKEIKDFKILIHCFTGSHQFALKLIDLGCYISASGVVTFKNSKSLANTFLNLPNDRILVETDSPYLSPEPLRGKSNEPSHIIHTVNFLANLKKINSNEFANITTDNFFRLFGKLN
jgi:TatD DNase family protein